MIPRFWELKRKNRNAGNAFRGDLLWSKVGDRDSDRKYRLWDIWNCKPDFLKEHRTASMEAARRQEVKTGPALVRTSISGQVKDYSVEIQRIDMTGNKKNKSLVIKITDPELLNLTGGIIQEPAVPRNTKTERSSGPSPTYLSRILQEDMGY